jgi:aminocarboxymuconate-semialdehyde decarboxylase
MSIDMHSHYYGGLVDGLRRREARPSVSKNSAGQLVLNAMTASTVMTPGYTDLAARRAFMDRARISTQLMTFPGALGVDVMPIAEARDIVCDFNDHLAEICRGSGGAFVGLGGLPLADMAEAAGEMRRLRSVLRLGGAILPGNYFLSAAAADLLRPVLAVANDAGALIMVHPGLMPGELPPEPYADGSILRASALNLQASLSHMALTLLTNGFLDAYPNITFQVVNLGGTLPFIVERMEAIGASRDLPGSVGTAALRRLVYDSASLGPRALETAVRVIGADRIMLGTDYPIFEPAKVLDSVKSAMISAADQAMVRSGTASAILERFF